MKLAGTSILIFALLSAGVVHGFPTLKARAKKCVVSGKSSYYTVHLSTGVAALDSATLKVIRLSCRTSTDRDHKLITPSFLRVDYAAQRREF